jgi:hypothetical protein
MGESTDVSGWVVTVHSFTLVPSDSQHQTGPSQIFCAVEWTLENSSGQTRYFMPERQALLEYAGQVYHTDVQAAVQAARVRQWLVPEGQQDVAKKVHGAAAYQIPQGAQNVCWTFVSGLLPGAPRVTFSLGQPAQP